MQTGKAPGPAATPTHRLACAHTCAPSTRAPTHRVHTPRGEEESQPVLILFGGGMKRDWSQSGHEGPQLGLCPLPVPGDTPLPPLTLSVLCPQAPAAGEGPSGTGIVCGAAAPSSPLNQLSLFFSFMLLFSSCHVAGFSFQLSPLQAHVRINAGGVLCRAGGSPACLCRTPPSLPLAPSLGEIPPLVPHTRRPQQSWFAGVEEPSS